MCVCLCVCVWLLGWLITGDDLASEILHDLARTILSDLYGIF